MTYKRNRVVVIGTGFVGASYAYALTLTSVVEELVLIDINKEKAMGEALDLHHSQLFCPTTTTIWQGDYDDCAQADLVVINAGISQSDEVTRLTGIERNTEIIKTIVNNVMASGFDGIFVISSNPVDLMTYLVWKVSGLPKERVIGTGTLLDTSRFRYELAQYFNVNLHNISGYVLGEHGDSQTAIISSISVAGKSINEFIQSDPKVKWEHFEEMAEYVTNVANTICDYKQATYYGIGSALMWLTKVILKDEQAVLPVSAYVEGEYDLVDMYIGVPAIVGRDGIKSIIEIPLLDEEYRKLHLSANVIQSYTEEINRLLS